MKILGISAYYHDSAACILDDGVIIGAVQEERFTRAKHDKSFPINAVNYCLKSNKIKVDEIDYIAFYDNWFLKKKRNIDNVLAQGSAASENFFSSINNQINENELINEIKTIFKWKSHDIENRLHYIQHHYSHAASAFYCSPFLESTVITVDGVGEYSTTTIGYGKNKELKLTKSLDFPNSLGLFYSSFTNYMGFKVNTGEYKLMGLAPYGKPIYKEKILENIIHLNDDGSYSLNMEFFKFQFKNEMINKKKVFELLNVDSREENEEISQKHKDLAASVQSVLEKALINLFSAGIKETNCKNLSLAGGVALNCKAIGKIKNLNLANNIFVQPAAGDAGGAMGCALALYYKISNNREKIDHKFNVYSGPNIENENVSEFIEQRGCPHIKYTNDEIYKVIAKGLSVGKTFAICQGKAEWGPRALGNRSIIANPIIKDIKKTLNLKIKQREDFRPFAPIIIEEHANKLFINSSSSPYMSNVFFLNQNLREESAELSINQKLLTSNDLKSVKAAVIHEDWSARVQTVNENQNRLMYLILKNFFGLTGCPMLINTSFNTRGEPPVLNEKDAFRCLMRTEIDYLVLNNYILERKKQPLLTVDEIEVFDPD